MTETQNEDSEEAYLSQLSSFDPNW